MIMITMLVVACYLTVSLLVYVGSLFYYSIYDEKIARLIYIGKDNIVKNKQYREEINLINHWEKVHKDVMNGAAIWPLLVIILLCMFIIYSTQVVFGLIGKYVRIPMVRLIERRYKNKWSKDVLKGYKEEL